MTVLDTTPDAQKFGVGTRIGDTLAIFGSHFPVFAAVGAVIGIIGQLPFFFLIGDPAITSTFDSSDDAAVAAAFGSTPVLAIVVSILVPMLVYAVISGIFVLAAHDARSGQPVRILSYVGATLRKIVPLILVTLIVGMGIGIGAVALVVPGLWVMGVFSVVVPAIMIESAGFGSLGRSSSLTKEYRWPIVGFLVVTYILTAILNMAVGLAITVLPAAVAVVLSGAVDGITAALLSISVTVVYARLREIKEGVGFGNVANVFS